jgi:hypothetical protein
VPPRFKVKAANDVDYTAAWFYIKTKHGPRGIISGSGASYSRGAPSDSDVWRSAEYAEIMDDSGIVDASGHSADGKHINVVNVAEVNGRAVRIMKGRFSGAGLGGDRALCQTGEEGANVLLLACCTRRRR